MSAGRSVGMPDAATTIKEHELQQVDRANKTRLPPVVFVRGLWLLPSSWDRWAAVLEKAGFAALTPGWPDDPDTVAEANAHPEVLAHKTIGQVADHSRKSSGRCTRSLRSSATPSAACLHRSSRAGV